MGMFSRINDIVQANINAMLDKAEDPEKVIRLIIQEMEETLVEIRSVAAKNLAEQKQIDRQIEGLNKQIANWQGKAQLAVEKKRDDLARAALSEKHNVECKVEALNEQKAAIDDAIKSIQEDTARLQAKLAEARNKQKSLVVRKQSSVARLQAKQAVHSHSIENAVARFDQYESRVEALEAQVDAFDIVPSASNVEQEFANLEQQESVEAELAKLKAKMTKKSTPKASTKAAA